ncbi:MAG: hypothetical protein JNG88_16180 [Phycisphaerales bacterium]|nr:hypothetical protein [Phycisphaerales bacterium]
MRDRVRIEIPTDGLKAGDVVEVFGPGAGGALETGTPIARVAALADREALGVRGSGQGAHGPASGERLPLVIASEPLAFGAKSFAARTISAAGGASSLTATKTVWVNGAPDQPRDVRPVWPDATLGRRKFTFTRSADFE